MCGRFTRPARLTLAGCCSYAHARDTGFRVGGCRAPTATSPTTKINARRTPVTRKWACCAAYSEVTYVAHQIGSLMGQLPVRRKACLAQINLAECWYWYRYNRDNGALTMPVPANCQERTEQGSCLDVIARSRLQHSTGTCTGTSTGRAATTAEKGRMPRHARARASAGSRSRGNHTGRWRLWQSRQSAVRGADSLPVQWVVKCRRILGSAQLPVPVSTIVGRSTYRSTPGWCRATNARNSLTPS